MSAFEYIRAIVATAVTHALDVTQTIIFVLFLFLWLLVWLVPSLKLSVDVTTAQVAAVILGAVVALRLLFAPYWLYKDAERQRDALQVTLNAIGLERPLSYDHVDFVTTVRGNVCDLAATVFFVNHGQRTLRWRVLSIGLELNGARLAPIPVSQYYFVNQGQQAWFIYPVLQNAPFQQYPITADLMYEIEYDNVPAVHPRVSMRSIRFFIPGAPAQNIRSIDLVSDER